MTFIKDYVKLCKNTGCFYKDHWKGIIVMNAAIMGAELAWFSRDRIKHLIKEKFKEKEAE